MLLRYIERGNEVVKRESILHYSQQKYRNPSIKVYPYITHMQCKYIYLLTDRKMHQQISIELSKFSKIKNNKYHDRKITQQHSSESLSRKTS